MAQEHKLSKKDLKDPDSFQRFSARLVAFLAANRNLLLGLLGGALILAIGGLFWSQQQSKQAMEMETLFFEMEKLQKRDRDTPSKDLTGEMRKLLEQFEEGPQKMRARLLLADRYYEKGQYDASIEMYTEGVNKAQSGSLSHVLARKGMAYAYEGKKEYGRALEIYKSIIDSSPNFPLFYIYMGLARCYELSGDPANAVQVLRQMQTQFASHPDLEKVNQTLKRLEEPA